MFAFTNAPESYDYYYVKTIDTVMDKNGKPWRLIEISDPARFENCQRPRYGSGLKQAYTEENQAELNYWGLKLPS